MDIQNLALQIPSPLQPFVFAGRKVWVKRDDLIHPEISGNKWRKLEYNLLDFKDQGYKTLITFGGAFSNHLYATAAACHGLGIKSVAVIRGAYDEQNPTIQFLLNQEMDLHFWSRTAYRSKEKSTLFKDLLSRYAKPYVVPEGGNNHLALPGVAEMIEEIELQLPSRKKCYIIAAGTGTTAAGVLEVMDTHDQCIIIPVLKHKEIEQEILELAPNAINKNYSILNDYHFGGYAETPKELVNWKKCFEQDHDLELDPIYTAKLFYGLYDLLKKNVVSDEYEIIAIHTGGLQGNAGWNYIHTQ